jgi:hypothetical protein
MTSSSGFITLAFGKNYAEMAIDLALSVREYHSEPIAVIANKSAAKQLRKYRPSPFDQIIEIDDKIHPWGAKLLVAENCPYQHSAFIDCDILFLRTTEFLDFPLRSPLAMYGAYMYPESDFQTYFRSRDIFTDFKLKKYFWATSGIFIFNRDEAKPFFADCYKFYTEGIKKYPRYSSGGIADELVIGILSSQIEIQSIPCNTIHPWPMADRLPTLRGDEQEWPVVHIFSKTNAEYLDKLVQTINKRREKWHFATASEQIWRDKASSTPSLARKLKHAFKSYFARCLQTIRTTQAHSSQK